MNKVNLIMSVIVSVLVVTFGFTFLDNPETEVVERVIVERPVGGVSPDVYSYMNVYGAFSQGGDVTTVSTTSATYTLSFNEMATANRILVASTNGAALTLTLPASTTLPVFGGYRTWVIENGHTAAATTTTIAAGTGVDLQEPDGQNVVVGINNFAILTCFAKPSDDDIVCSVDEHIPAD